MLLKTEFPMFKCDHPHWESLLEIFDRYHLHENGYTGASYSEEHEIMMEALEMAIFDEDRPWCLEYTKKTFVAAWNKVKAMVMYWHSLDESGVEPNEYVVIPSLIYRHEY